jgi:hypothetical protein
MPWVGALVAPRLGCWIVADVDDDPPPDEPDEPKLPLEPPELPELEEDEGGGEETTGCGAGAGADELTGVLALEEPVEDEDDDGTLATAVGAGTGFGCDLCGRRRGL